MINKYDTSNSNNNNYNNRSAASQWHEIDADGKGKA
jgi:hypothetical protein